MAKSHCTNNCCQPLCTFISFRARNSVEAAQILNAAVMCILGGQFDVCCIFGPDDYLGTYHSPSAQKRPTDNRPENKVIPSLRLVGFVVMPAEQYSRP